MSSKTTEIVETQTPSTTAPIPALPAPSDVSDAQKIDLSSEQLAALSFDALGPMVVNSDGTLSRITNWEKMTEMERERTMRVLNARNRLHLANEQEKQGSNMRGDVVSLGNSAAW